MIVAMIALALASCHREQSAGSSEAARPATSEMSRSAATGSTTTPANLGAPSQAERKNGGNPVQQQVDPRHADQHKDFQQRGDDAGPQSTDTQPTMKNQ
jgi:hypothetical protein